RTRQSWCKAKTYRVGVLSNLFDQNAPAIAVAEGQYEEMWAADVSAMAGYHCGASAAAAGVDAPAGPARIGRGKRVGALTPRRRPPARASKIRAYDSGLQNAATATTSLESCPDWPTVFNAGGQAMKGPGWT